MIVIPVQHRLSRYNWVSGLGKMGKISAHAVPNGVLAHQKEMWAECKNEQTALPRKSGALEWLLEKLSITEEEKIKTDPPLALLVHRPISPLTQSFKLWIK